MSEKDKTDSIINEIKDIYNFLTEEEPTPDYEIDAQKILIERLNELKQSDGFQNYVSRIEKILKKLREWDTLDHWFIETSIPQDLNDLLKIKKPESTEAVEAKEEKEVEKKQKVIAPDVDISDIVSQITAEFKGKISDLEKKINTLHQQLEKKDERISELKKDENIVKKKAKMKSRLPPLKIDLSQIKKPAVFDSGDKISKEESKEDIGKVEQEPKIKKKVIPQKKEEKIQEKERMLKISSEQLKESMGEKEIKAEVEIEEIESKIENKKEKKIEKPILKPLSINEVHSKKEEKSTIKAPIPNQKDKKSPSQPSISIITEEIISESTKNNYKEKEPFAEVKIEEVEAKEKKSSASELYNVFSSITQKNNTQKKQTKSKTKSKTAGKALDSTSRKELKEVSVNDFELEESFADEAFQASIEELPKDKDILYQELIALEGKRYSLEKTLNKLENRYEKGTIDESTFRNQIEKLQVTLGKITNRIGDLRGIIKSI